MMTVKETHKIGEDLFFVIQYMNSSLDEYVIVLRTTDEQVARDKVKRMWDKDICRAPAGALQISVGRRTCSPKNL